MARRDSRLSLDDLAGLDAAGAHAYTLAGSSNDCLDRLQVYVPAAAGGVVGVGDVVAELRTLAAEITFLRHVLTPISYCSFFPQGRRSPGGESGASRVPAAEVGGLKLGRRESADNSKIRALAGRKLILKTLVVHYSKESMTGRSSLEG
jgi:hypothetical protein